MIHIILFIILINFIIIHYLLNKKEMFINQDIHFLNKYELKNILLQDKDQYYQTFFKKDFEVRKINNINDYLKIISKSVCDYHSSEKKKIIDSIEKINKQIKKIKNKYPQFHFIHLDKFLSLPWKFGLVCSKKYENGLPHTRQQYIIFEKKYLENISQKSLMKTLIHEKVHVYQKMYPQDIQYYLNHHQFKKIKPRESKDLIRANPDLDNFIYHDKHFNTYKAVYNNDAINLEDITYFPHDTQFYEHPFEQMAIKFEKIIN
jgi:hypothetical protein